MTRGGGAGAAAAVTAATQYINWLTTTQAEVEAAQTAVATSLAAYEAARTGVVNLATVTANRTAYYAAVGGLPFTAATVATLETAYAGFETTDIAVMNVYQAADTAARPGLTTPPVDVTGPSSHLVGFRHHCGCHHHRQLVGVHCSPLGVEPLHLDRRLARHARGIQQHQRHGQHRGLVRRQHHPDRGVAGPHACRRHSAGGGGR